MHVELCVLLCVLQIVALSDGVMVARGDLGVEMNPWDVPVLQKRIVETCKFLGKPVVSVQFTISLRVATTRAVCQMTPALTGNLMYAQLPLIVVSSRTFEMCRC
jgi:pyruvate kinase